MTTQLLALVLSVAAAIYLDRRSQGLGLTPPGFQLSPLRRAGGAALLAAMFFLGSFGPILAMGEAAPLDPSTLPVPSLFAGHALLLGTVVIWMVLAYAGTGSFPLASEAGRQLGLRTGFGAESIALGMIAGLAAWLAMVVVGLIMVGLLSLLSPAEDWLPQGAPPAIAYMAGLPLLVRLALVLSAGFFEELFYRGLLQPRIGIVLSTLLFVFAHAGYGQPSMLISLTVVSLVMAGLVVWRQSLWPAVIAHATFDAIQLLVLIPAVLPLVPVERAGGP